MKLIIAFIKTFGLLNGLKIGLQFFFKSTNKLQLPGISSPLLLRKNTSDYGTFKQVFIDGEYNIQYGFVPKTIIDAGANIGLYSVMAKNKFADAQIICLEPDKENFETLQANLSNYKNIFFENAGLWNKDSMLKAYDKFESGKWGIVVEESLTEGNVKGLTVSTLLQKYNWQQIDVFKIDIETSEKIVFADNYETWLPKVKMLIIEFHDWIVPNTSKPFFEAINKCFKSYSFSSKGENVIIVNNDL
jgi:FkbM family methyltransferase